MDNNLMETQETQVEVIEVPSSKGKSVAALGGFALGALAVAGISKIVNKLKDKPLKLKRRKNHDEDYDDYEDYEEVDSEE